MRRVAVCRRGLCSYSRAKKAFTKRPDRNIDRIIRVDHAGEVGADRIYAGQYAVLKNTSVGPVIKVKPVLCNRMMYGGCGVTLGTQIVVPLRSF